MKLNSLEQLKNEAQRLTSVSLVNELSSSGDNTFSSTWQGKIPHLPELKELYIYAGEISALNDVIYEVLRNSPKLEKFTLEISYDPRMSLSIPKIPTLKTMSLFGYHGSDEGLYAILNNLENLTKLRLNRCTLSRPEPTTKAPIKLNTMEQLQTCTIDDDYSRDPVHIWTILQCSPNAKELTLEKIQAFNSRATILPPPDIHLKELISLEFYCTNLPLLSKFLGCMPKLQTLSTYTPDGVTTEIDFPILPEVSTLSFGALVDWNLAIKAPKLSIVKLTYLNGVSIILQDVQLPANPLHLEIKNLVSIAVLETFIDRLNLKKISCSSIRCDKEKLRKLISDNMQICFDFPNVLDPESILSNVVSTNNELHATVAPRMLALFGINSDKTKREQDIKNSPATNFALADGDHAIGLRIEEFLAPVQQKNAKARA